MNFKSPVRWACAAVLSASLGTPAAAATFIATPDTAAALLKTIGSGDTLQFVGSFGTLRMLDRSFTKTVTLDLTKASFTNTLNLSRINNLKVIGGRFDVTAGSIYSRAAVVYGGSNISFDKTVVVGTAGQIGISFAGTSHATVSNGRFDGLQVGVAFGSVTGGIALKNRITHAVSDGIDIADSHHVTASFNTCSLGTPGVGVHPDCIQLWSNPGQPLQSDNIITRNTATGPTQGFTSFSAGGGGLRLQITRNIVSTSFPQGIACYECVDSIITYNTLTTLPGSQYLTNLNVVGGSGNTMLGNVIHQFPVVIKPKAKAGAQIAAQSASSAAVTVPEPSSWTMLIVGFAAVGVARRRATGQASVSLA